MGPERVHGLWKYAGLQLPRRSPRRRVATDSRPLPPQAITYARPYDFEFDANAERPTEQMPDGGRTTATRFDPGRPGQKVTRQQVEQRTKSRSSGIDSIDRENTSSVFDLSQLSR